MSDLAVTEVRVETQSDGSLVVTWETDGRPVEVDVLVGPTPYASSHRRCVTVRSDQRRALVPAGGPDRQFVSIVSRGREVAAIAADRRVPFRDVTNFRDLGGYPTRTGAHVRWGLVFRSAALCGLGPSDLAQFERLGVRVVFDLRGDTEREEHPNAVPSRQLTITGRPPNGEAPEETVPRLTAADGEARLVEAYRGLIDHAGLQIGRLFSDLTAEGGTPAVIHCLAGKDRTGVVAALLLELLGVERSLVLDDYELSARYVAPSQQQPTYARLIEAGYSAEAARAVTSTPRRAMAETLSYLDRVHGGIEPYVMGPAGMRPDCITLLRERLLEPFGQG